MKIKLAFLSFSLIFNFSVYGAKQLSAHVHGSVGLDIAAEKKQILIMLKSPADSFLGFEYRPKTKKEKDLIKKVKLTWLKNIKSMINGKSLEDCKQGKSNWQLKYQGSHSEIIAEAYLNCKSKVASKEIMINFKKSYPRIETIHLQLLRSNGSALSKKFKTKTYKVRL